VSGLQYETLSHARRHDPLTIRTPRTMEQAGLTGEIERIDMGAHRDAVHRVALAAEKVVGLLGLVCLGMVAYSAARHLGWVA